MNIEIISASAGTGKTTRLAQLLDEALQNRVRPEAVLATTFTRKAAAELRERARLQLLGNNQVEAAQMLGAAWIGTVNAVCAQLVGRYALLLGLSPALRVMDENEARDALAQCLALQQSSPQAGTLFALSQRLDELNNRRSYLAIAPAVHQIVQMARSNGLADLAVSRQRSIDGLLSLLGPALPDADALANNLQQALEGFIAGIHPDDPQLRKNTRDAYSDAQAALHKLRGAGLPWSGWVKLANLDAGAQFREAVAPVHQAAALHDSHPGLHQDTRDMVAGIFDLAQHVMADYADYKAQRGAMDFVDQEVLALQALHHPEVQADLRARLDLVLVDEFQDTSPLQLAIFLKLAALAPRSVWVGDAKQAIYSFRGTDPALMGAVVADIGQGNDEDGTAELLNRALHAVPESRITALRTSWRSRPALVQLTSRLFAEAFAAHGMPRHLVEIDAARPTEPQGLGPIAEVWQLHLEKRAQTRQLPAIAAQGVHDLLQDPNVQVRDRITGQARRVRPGDVAVLCRKNDACQTLADALTALGIAAQLPRHGLLRTREGEALHAALMLWCDPQAALPAATLSRLLDGAAPETWLDAAMAHPGHTAFAEQPAVVAVQRSRLAHADACVVGCVQACLHALQLRDLCRQWGDSAQRLANVDALVAHARTYQDTQAAQGDAATVAGLLYHFETLQQAQHDACATLPHDDPQAPGAVSVTTWHAAKGLEWPVVVLLGLEPNRDRPTAALGARAESPPGVVDLHNPLHGRWIRFWSTPYHGSQTKTPFYQRMQAHPDACNARDQADREALRLLYVGWTRARDRLVLAVEETPEKYTDGLLAPLRPETHLPRPEGPEVVWADMPLSVPTRRLDLPTVPPKPAPQPGMGYPQAPPRVHPPARSRPSQTHAGGRVVQRLQLGPRLALQGHPDMAALGNAVHGFFAADHPGQPKAGRQARAHNALQAWHVDGNLRPDDLLQASDALHAWVHSQWPSAVWLSEVPLTQLLSSGTHVVGQADLLVDIDTAWLLFDHKTYPGALAEAEHRAVAHSGQLAAYSRAVHAATRKPVQACYIHLPISGSLLQVDVAMDTDPN